MVVVEGGILECPCSWLVYVQVGYPRPRQQGRLNVIMQCFSFYYRRKKNIQDFKASLDFSNLQLLGD